MAALDSRRSVRRAFLAAICRPSRPARNLCLKRVVLGKKILLATMVALETFLLAMPADMMVCKVVYFV